MSQLVFFAWLLVLWVIVYSITFLVKQYKTQKAKTRLETELQQIWDREANK